MINLKQFEKNNGSVTPIAELIVTDCIILR